jgi:hypothetical protein
MFTDSPPLCSFCSVLVQSNGHCRRRLNPHGYHAYSLLQRAHKKETCSRAKTRNPQMYCWFWGAASSLCLISRVAAGQKKKQEVASTATDPGSTAAATRSPFAMCTSPTAAVRGATAAVTGATSAPTQLPINSLGISLHPMPALGARSPTAPVTQPQLGFWIRDQRMPGGEYRTAATGIYQPSTDVLVSQHYSPTWKESLVAAHPRFPAKCRRRLRLRLKGV